MLTTTTLSAARFDIVALLDKISPAVTRIAMKYHLDPDDLLQEMSLWILEHAEKLAAMDQPAGYCIGTAQNKAQNQVYHQSRSVKPVVSLDAPVTDSDVNLLDVLPAPDNCTVDTTLTDNRAQLVHEALRRLRLEEQAYLRRVYELNAYNPVPLPGRAPNYNRSNNAMRSRAFYQLRRDTSLLAMVGGAL